MTKHSQLLSRRLLSFIEQIKEIKNEKDNICVLAANSTVFHGTIGSAPYDIINLAYLPNPQLEKKNWTQVQNYFAIDTRKEVKLTDEELRDFENGKLHKRDFDFDDVVDVRDSMYSKLSSSSINTELYSKKAWFTDTNGKRWVPKDRFMTDHTDVVENLMEDGHTFSTSPEFTALRRNTVRLFDIKSKESRVIFVSSANIACNRYALDSLEDGGWCIKFSVQKDLNLINFNNIQTKAKIVNFIQKYLATDVVLFRNFDLAFPQPNRIQERYSEFKNDAFICDFLYKYREPLAKVFEKETIHGFYFPGYENFNDEIMLFCDTCNLKEEGTYETDGIAVKGGSNNNWKQI